MRFRRLFRVILSFSAMAITLCSLPTDEPLSVPPAQASATIAATATVIEPLGLVEQPSVSPHQQFLLYSPHSGHTICQVSVVDANGLSLNGPSAFTSESASAAAQIQAPWAESPGLTGSTYLVTVIYSEN